MQVSVIIPTYNSIKHIERCLNSVVPQASLETEIIVIDNGSIDGTTDLLRQRFPRIKLICNQTNLGSSYARNQGIGQSSAEYIVFLDSDAYLAEDFFRILLDALGNLIYPVAGFTPKIINQSSGTIFSLGLIITPLLRVLDIKNKNDLKGNIDGFNSCCAVIRKSALDSVKDKGQYFDNEFFFLFEDADISLRMRRQGFSFIHLDNIIAYHYGSGSDFALDFRRYLCFRNRMYMIFKNKSPLQVIMFFLLSFFYDFFRTLHFVITNKYAFVALNDIIKKQVKISK